MLDLQLTVWLHQALAPYLTGLVVEPPFGTDHLANADLLPNLIASLSMG